MRNPAELERYLGELRTAAGVGARSLMVAAVARSLGAEVDADLDTFQHGESGVVCAVPEPPSFSPDEAFEAADLLGLVVQAITNVDDRHSGGMYFTPRAVADALVELAFKAYHLSNSGPLWAGVVMDPTCGGGAFLLAAARWMERKGATRGEAISALRGVDLDPVAAATCRTALGLWAGVDPSKVAVATGNGFEAATLFESSDRGNTPTVIVGNPPFQSQLGTHTARSATDSSDLKERFGTMVRPYVDTAALFLLDAIRQVRPGGVVGLVLPQSVLATNDVEPIRREISETAALVSLWMADEAGFDAAVRVCAPVLQVGAAQESVDRYGGAVPTFEQSVTPCEPSWQWSEYAADQMGVPRVAVKGHRVIAEEATATAGFRDEYYAMADAVCEASPGSTASPRLITSGLVEPLDTRWGIDEARFAKQKWMRPTLDENRLAANERVFRWYQARRVPKLLLATQTRVLEVVVDPEGILVPITPVISVEADPDRLWHLAAALTNPVTSIVAFRRTAGAALASNAIKVSASQVLALPLPASGDAWDRGADLAKSLALDLDKTSGSARKQHLNELGAVMCDAYNVAPDGPLQWWSDRLRFTAPESSLPDTARGAKSDAGT